MYLGRCLGVEVEGEIMRAALRLLQSIRPHLAEAPLQGMRYPEQVVHVGARIVQQLRAERPEQAPRQCQRLVLQDNGNRRRQSEQLQDCRFRVADALASVQHSLIHIWQTRGMLLFEGAC